MTRPADAIAIEDLLDMALRAGFDLQDFAVLYRSGLSKELLFEGMKLHAAARTVHLVAGDNGLRLVVAIDPANAVASVWDSDAFQSILQFEKEF